ncbi:hypothetical protein THAOC_16265, partial [Thalassiosira oceanica]
KPAATEVRYGIELSPCSAACPSGTIYLHLLLAQSLLGSLAAPRAPRAPRRWWRLASRSSSNFYSIHRSDNAAAGMNRCPMEACGCGAIRVALGAPCIFLESNRLYRGQPCSLHTTQASV